MPGRNAASKPFDESATITPTAESEPGVPPASSDEDVPNAQSIPPLSSASPDGADCAPSREAVVPSRYSSNGYGVSLPLADAPLRVMLVQDPLQITAEQYPWLYMSSTLEAFFEEPEPPNTSKRQGVVSEGGSGDRRASETIVLSDEKQSDKFIKAAPAAMRAFHAHGETCTLVEAKALKLALQDREINEEAQLQRYYDILGDLERLHAEALELESSIVELTSGYGRVETNENSEHSARAQVFGVIAACLPVIRARITNLSMAQELTDSALENLSISLRMESLGIE